MKEYIMPLYFGTAEDQSRVDTGDGLGITGRNRCKLIKEGFKVSDHFQVVKYEKVPVLFKNKE